MKKSSIIILVSFLCSFTVSAQKADTIRKYLDQELKFTSRKNAVFPALQVKTNDHWILYSVYPDTGTLIKAYFLDKDLTIKDGPYVLYHPKKIKAVEGYYAKNLSTGIWRYWYVNGQIKDSGQIINNQLSGLWKSWYENGNLQMEIHYSDVTDGGTPGKSKQDIVSLIPDHASLKFTMNGEAKTYYKSGKLLDSGAYSANLKQGVWKKWYENGKLESMGKFVNNIMTDDWEFYRENGNRSSREKYVNSKVVSMECYDEDGKSTGSYCSILKPPVALGNFNDFNEYVLDNVFWPKDLKDENIQGKVKVKYTVTKEGKLKNLIIVSSPHELLSKEVERFFGTIENWSPAISHNRAVDFEMEYEVPFLR